MRRYEETGFFGIIKNGWDALRAGRLRLVRKGAQEETI
jgi:hypothetical protein